MRKWLLPLLLLYPLFVFAQKSLPQNVDRYTNPHTLKAPSDFPTVV
jgi:hypothetical protein